MVAEAVFTSVGFSAKTDAVSAGKEAAEAAWQRFSAPMPKLAIVFGSSWFDQTALLGGIRSVLKDTLLIGGSTAGEISMDGPMSHSCAVMLIGGSDFFCSVGLGLSADSDPRQAGHQAAFEAVQKFSVQKRTGFLFLGDGLVRGYADVIRGMEEALGTSFLIAGGLAGDDLRFSRTWQYANSKAVSGGLAGVLLGGSLKMGVGLEHGFVPISKPHRITRSKANILFELDRLPALSVYEDYFGNEAIQRMRSQHMTRQSIAFPLGIRQTTQAQWLLRNVVEFRNDGSLACNAEVPEGASMQLMMGSRKPAIEAAFAAAQRAVQSLNRVLGIIVFDSALRRILLGPQSCAEEWLRIRHAVGAHTPLIGCYGYGEHAAPGTAIATERVTIHTASVLVAALGT